MRTINPYIFYAIGIIIFLVIVFIVTFLLNRKTPVPKGCKNLKISEETCSSCTTTDCSFKQGIDFKKIDQELSSQDEEDK